jgi:hypothetical protein
MQKHRFSQSGICPAAPQGFLPVQLSPYAFQRQLRRSARVSSPGVVGFQVFGLPCGCYVWVHYSGLRSLSLLPF